MKKRFMIIISVILSVIMSTLVFGGCFSFTWGEVEDSSSGIFYDNDGNLVDSEGNILEGMEDPDKEYQGGGQERDYLKFYIWGSDKELQQYQYIAEEFYDYYDFRVEVERATGDYYQGLGLKLNSSDGGPDIFFTQESEIKAQLDTHQLLNLHPYINSGELDVKTESNPDGKIELWELNDVYRFNRSELGSGSYFALVKDWSPDYVLWYNKNMIDEYNAMHGYTPGSAGYMEYPSETVPMTWSQFIDFSYKLSTVRADTYGTMLDRTPFAHLMEFVQMTGESVWDEEGKYFNNSENVAKAFQYFVEMQVGPKASAPKMGSTATDSGVAFANQNTATCWFGNWAYSANLWENNAFNFGIAPPPLPDRDTPYTADDRYGVTSGMIGLAINNKTSNPEMAVKFLEFYMTDGQEYLAKKGFNISGNKKVASSDVFLNPENEQLKYINNFFYDFAQYTDLIRYNQFIGGKKVESVFGTYLTELLNGTYAPENITQMLDKIEAGIKREVEW